MVVWIRHNIYGQRFDPNGNPVGAEFQANIVPRHFDVEINAGNVSECVFVRGRNSTEPVLCTDDSLPGGDVVTAASRN